MSADFAHELERTDGDERELARSRTLRAVRALARPCDVVGGVVWALLQPYRITLLHPHGQGVWWLGRSRRSTSSSSGSFFRLVSRRACRDLEDEPVIVAGAHAAAEHVHWWFATGFLVLGLLLLAEGSSGPRCGVAGRGGATCGRASVRDGPAHVAGDGVLHQLDDPHGRARLLGRDDDARRRGAARPRGGEARIPLWKLTSRIALFVAGIALLVHEQNGWLFSRAAFLHHLLGWTAIVGAVFPVDPGASSALDRRRFRLRDVLRRRSPCSSTATATSRRSSATCPSSPGRRTDETRASPRRTCRARASRRRRSRTRRCGRRRRLRAAARPGSPRQVVLQFDQTVDVLPKAIQVFTTRRQERRRHVHAR